MNGPAALAHYLSLLETSSRTAREMLAAGIEIKNNPPRPQLALSGQPPTMTPAQAEQLAGELVANSMRSIQQVLELAERLRTEFKK